LNTGPDELEKTIPRDLIESARRVAMNAYAPYSRYCVGAAAEAADGRVFTGTNMENASYGLTVCAEVGALQAALAAGALDQIRRMAIAGGPMHRNPADAAQSTPPCGRCRQLIAEAAALGRYDIEVWFTDLDGRQIDMRPISVLLPAAFNASHVGGAGTETRMPSG